VVVVGAANRFVYDGSRDTGIGGVWALGLEVERPRRIWREGLVAAMAALNSCLTKQGNERAKYSVFMVLNRAIKRLNDNVLLVRTAPQRSCPADTCSNDAPVISFSSYFSVTSRRRKNAYHAIGQKP